MLHRMPLPEGPMPDISGKHGRPPSRDDHDLALSLITTWTMRTGRILRPAPVSELTPEELVNFWADDQLEPPLAAPVHNWPPA